MFHNFIGTFADSVMYMQNYAYHKMGKCGEIFYNTLKKTYYFNSRTYSILWDIQDGFFGLEVTKISDQISTSYPISTLTFLTQISTRPFLEDGLR